MDDGGVRDAGAGGHADAAMADPKKGGSFFLTVPTNKDPDGGLAPEEPLVASCRRRLSQLLCRDDDPPP